MINQQRDIPKSLHGHHLGGGGGVVPMSHVDYKKWQCHPVEFKKSSNVPGSQAAFPNGPQSGPCGAHLGPNFAQLGPNRGPHGMLLGLLSTMYLNPMSLSPRKGRVALSIVGVHSPHLFIGKYAP